MRTTWSAETQQWIETNNLEFIRTIGGEEVDEVVVSSQSTSGPSQRELELYGQSGRGRSYILKPVILTGSQKYMDDSIIRLNAEETLSDEEKRDFEFRMRKNSGSPYLNTEKLQEQLQLDERLLGNAVHVQLASYLMRTLPVPVLYAQSESKENENTIQLITAETFIEGLLDGDIETVKRVVASKFQSDVDIESICPEVDGKCDEESSSPVDLEFQSLLTDHLNWDKFWLSVTVFVLLRCGDMNPDNWKVILNEGDFELVWFDLETEGTLLDPEIYNFDLKSRITVAAACILRNYLQYSLNTLEITDRSEWLVERFNAADWSAIFTLLQTRSEELIRMCGDTQPEIMEPSVRQTRLSSITSSRSSRASSLVNFQSSVTDIPAELESLLSDKVMQFQDFLPLYAAQMGVSTPLAEDAVSCGCFSWMSSCFRSSRQGSELESKKGALSGEGKSMVWVSNEMENIQCM